MYAIIETGGKQIRVEKDAVIFVEKLEANEGDTVTFDKVLYADGKFGKPFVEGAKVTGVVEKRGRKMKEISAFIVEKGETDAEGIPAWFELTGAGWGHGVGLCQIGAAVMGEQGYNYNEILLHYYKGADIRKLY